MWRVSLQQDQENRQSPEALGGCCSTRHDRSRIHLLLFLCDSGNSSCRRVDRVVCLQWSSDYHASWDCVSASDHRWSMATYLTFRCCLSAQQQNEAVRWDPSWSCWAFYVNRRISTTLKDRYCMALTCEARRAAMSSSAVSEMSWLGMRRLVEVEEVIATVDPNSQLSNGHPYADICCKSLNPAVCRHCTCMNAKRQCRIDVLDALIQPEQDSRARQNQSNHDLGPHPDTV